MVGHMYCREGRPSSGRGEGDDVSCPGLPPGEAVEASANVSHTVQSMPGEAGGTKAKACYTVDRCHLVPWHDTFLELDPPTRSSSVRHYSGLSQVSYTPTRDTLTLLESLDDMLGGYAWNILKHHG